ncbi:unnamed protein product [Camellia sinensis]
MAHMMFFISFLVSLAALQATHAVEYSATNNVPNTPGGIRFTNEIGLEYSKQTLATATEFCWRTFQQNSEADRRTTARLDLSIEDIDGTTGNIRFGGVFLTAFLKTLLFVIFNGVYKRRIFL